MPRTLRLINRSFYALAVCGALAFGVSEAFAAPAQDQARPYCDPVKCNAACGGYGLCSGYNCFCY